MKRKILLTALIVIALISAFAISVFATDFGTLETIDGMPERSKLDTTSRVVLFDGTDYHTYPAYYIFLNEATSKMDFTNINTKTGKSYDKTKVVLLEFPEGQTSVGGMESATLLEYVKIPDSATTLRSFKGSPALETIEFSKQGNLITVNDQAFSDCTALTTGSLPEGVTSAGTNVFIRCTSLTSAAIPSTLQTINQNMYNGCTSLASVTIPQGVITIGRQSFYGCTLLGEIIIPSSVTTIGENAFYGCTSIEEVSIPSSVQTLGVQAFYGCTALSSISFSQGLKSIGKNCFLKCSSLACDIILPEGLTEIGYKAFSETPITSVVVPSTVTTLGTYEFYKCQSLTDAVVKCSTVSSYMFSECKLLETVEIPNIITINDRGFSKCPALANITFPEGLTTINSCAFFSCTALTSVVVPSTVTSMQDKIFESSGVKTAIVKSPILGERMFYATNIESITLINTVDIGANALYSGDFTELVLPKTVKTVGVGAFYSCIYMTSITVPKTVESFESDAFSNCTALRTVTFTGKNSEIIDSAVPSKATVVYKNHCEVYNNSVHTWGEEDFGFVGQAYITDFVNVSTCQECDISDITETICGPLFVNLGYSRSLDGTAFTYGISLNEGNISTYKSKTGEDITYGFIVGLAGTEAEEGKILSSAGEALISNSIVTDFTNVQYEKLNVYNLKMTSIDTEAQKELKIYCNAYVIEAGVVSYIGEVDEKYIPVAIQVKNLPVK